MIEKNYKVKKSYKAVEPHEIFLDTLAQSREEEFGMSEKKFEVPLGEKISYVLFVIFLFLAFILFAKIFYFQAVNGKKLYTAAQNNKGAINIIVPERGIIYDKNFKKLVSNSPAFDLLCDRSYFAYSTEQNEKEILYIASSLKIDAADVKTTILNASGAQVLIAENLTHDSLLLLEAKIGDMQGCKIQQNTTRNYLYGQMFSQVLGYTGRINQEEYSNSEGYSINDYIGKTGIESYYESYLRGKTGQTRPTKSGTQIGADVLVEPVAGENLILNIDARLQETIYNSLEKSIKRVGAERGAAVAMDPRTGAVLAIISYPSYDNNLFAKGISQADYEKIANDPNKPLFDRAIAAQYPTGSTIKPFEAAAVLQENLISPDKEIDDPGYILVRSQYDPDVVYKFGGVAPHGMVDMKKAIAVSSNIYFYTVGGGYGDQQGLGPTRIKKYLSLFGWADKTGIDLPGEFAGFIPSPEWKKQKKGSAWVDGDTYNLSIGQSDLQTTPLQVATAYSAIANGGTLYKPQIVNRVVQGPVADGKVVKEFYPQIIRQGFIDAKNLEIVREGMKDAVYQPYGLSAYLKDLPVTVASKTGTAEIGYQNQFNVWSAVFAPYENPEIVLVVTVEKVNGLGAVTLPVALESLSWYFGEK